MQAANTKAFLAEVIADESLDHEGKIAKLMRAWLEADEPTRKALDLAIKHDMAEQRKRGRPRKPDAMTSAERVAATRARRKAQGLCPCCGQPKPAKAETND